MATFKQQAPSRQGYFETLSNLSEQQLKNKNLRTDSTGVKSLTAGEQDAETKAAKVGEDVGAVQFKAPEIELPQPQTSVAAGATKAVDSLENRISKLGTNLNEEAVLKTIQTATNPAQEKIAKQTANVNAAVTAAVKALQDKAAADMKDHRKFIDDRMGGTAAQGETGQKSVVEEGDLAIANAMSDPSMRTSDVAQLAEVYKQFDPRLATLQGEIMRGEVNDLRGEALSALQGYTGAQAMTDATVGGLGDIKAETNERLMKQEQEFSDKLTAQEKEALDAVSTWRTGEEKALTDLEARAGGIAKKGAEVKAQRVETEGKAYANGRLSTKLKEAKYPLKVNNIEEFVAKEAELMKNPSYMGTQSRPIIEWLASDPKVAPSIQVWAKGVIGRLKINDATLQGQKQFKQELAKSPGIGNIDIRL